MTVVGCPRFRETAPDLALGLLAGDERGAALNHLARCSPCRRHLESLVEVTDGLLLLAPSVEPEIGFESRVMARLAAAGAFPPPPPPTPTAAAAPVLSGRRVGPRWRWSSARVLAIAAALVVVAGVSGLALGVARGGSDARGQQTARTVVLTADHGRSLCQLVAFPALGTEAARLVIHLDEPGEPSTIYQVLAERTHGGPAVALGQIVLVGGTGTLTTAIPPGTGPVDAVRIIEGADTVKYRATFQSV